MSMFTAFNISASGMTAQQLRTDVISQNIARQGLELLYIHLDTGEVQEHLLML